MIIDLFKPILEFTGLDLVPLFLVGIFLLLFLLLCKRS